ncbi:UNVERIFIED_ORG: uncharacterized protein YecE (DUF72 family) [Methylobacterium sp. SuP10 SLI 274]|uniref:DUF72 domain-containing protein n=1 Tax=Methylorubrum extorquens TaxID=408 RepID=UPI0020A22AB2|nr:DUF72 domain-containing protein [Methylorubrum extorquens]MDF9861287.1 uncharacterized protein YecE (DUF72 family) [Methylorubrum pseudosasae]MDH6634917.1 uncharacterized protein YecE (DUF72 family) [Methylobacterium sp. SuP10 SLI 274]MDH6664087.1 uncharacterized protein YecE (DUF72 family) [Methylorubrum zatmanii]MCP1561093.1 uncharacterized protein YecE (DUF72 family) [Methylorubrum extorquens]MDF9789570.1 uncharacterized protein YecE (DUF72 family) [Methylorubrum extorquens]
MKLLSVTSVGTAGWNVPRAYADRFPQTGSHLERYAQRFNAVEINTSFYRPHRVATYERWAAAVPEQFRFAVKVPRTITHERRLENVDEPLARFLDEIAGLGLKLGPLLLQLPPSLAFQNGTSGEFLQRFRRAFSGSIVCEPRHPSWFAPSVNTLLADLLIARVAVDPAPVPQASEPGGWQGLAYHRLHGSPRIYYSAYRPDVLDALAERLVAEAKDGLPNWCIFDNTAEFAATSDALSTLERLSRDAGRRM